jgi:hypothetical protein
VEQAKRCEHKIVWRSEPVTMPWSQQGRDDNEIISGIRDQAHPMLVVEIEAKSMAGVCRTIAEINDTTRSYGWTLDYPEDVPRCDCCGQALED